ncbi:LuxR C-terminal-related transcriptional regulator [Serratia sp. N21D137]|uniref:LuxR C-terminal-related transcriptional regulator n=1 Tax=Serratia sp. N21D137 TaxID=3397495 RepID=UPI0039E15725
MTSQLAQLAIVAESPLTRLGIEELVQVLRPEIRCTLQFSSVQLLRNNIQEQQIELLICELGGVEDAVQQTGKELELFYHSRPDIHLIVYTSTYDTVTLLSLYHLPQTSIISRYETPEIIHDCFLQALSGNRVYSPIIQSNIPKYAVGLEKLTAREYIVIEYLFCGLSSIEVAHRLQCSIKTISAHKRKAMYKLGVYSDAALFSLKRSFLLFKRH